ncbi:MAG: ABC transporter permease [Clostridiaceae bacterium]|nr:ABC transporter permease [Clostridiaceae bacterium]
MSNQDNLNHKTYMKPDEDQHISISQSLDDEQRIKVLSPSMLVFKRFIRNKLAVTGVICIGLMFIFSFIGGWIMPYGESQVFTEYRDMSKDYASAILNTEFRYTEADGKSFPAAARAKFVKAINDKALLFESQGQSYTCESQGDDFYLVSSLIEVATALRTGKTYDITAVGGQTVSSDFKTQFMNALESGSVSFEADGKTYTVTSNKKLYSANISETIALATKNVFDYASSDTKDSFEFQYQAEYALNQKQKQFTVAGQDYQINIVDDSAEISLINGSEKTYYATLSNYIVQAAYPDVFLTPEFLNVVKQAIDTDQTSFNFAINNSEVEFTIVRNNDRWTIRKIDETLVIKSYEYPSSVHFLGTDDNGMDIITRMMFGGRISLMIGFIVVFIETFIGIILGGVAGYFGKWIDNLLMRLVDIFNCIPSLPLIIIIGAIMDSLKVDPQVRMVYLMLILGLLGWPGIARLVRGQILSLREQEFMVAAEATGLSVYRKIFRHLIPNVVPQLIVVATMSLGSTILTESVLSFLGLGVKFPFASWGNIINAVSNVHVMTNYWFVWIPAGFCILITVLGFNFIGDGLRDAFDPKMRR